MEGLERIVTNIKTKNGNVIQYKFPPGQYTTHQVSNVLRHYGDAMVRKKANGKVSVALRVNNGWKSSKKYEFKNAGNTISTWVYGMEDEENEGDDPIYTNVSMFVYPEGATAGGATKRRGTKRDMSNDCLFNAIKAYAPKHIVNNMNPDEIRKALNIPLNEPVDIKYIPAIEDILQLKIMVSGEHTYESGKDYLPQVHVRLYRAHFEEKGHYEQKVPFKEEWKVHGVSTIEAEILIHGTFSSKSKEVRVCNGKLEWDMDIKYFMENYDKPFTSKYRFIKESGKIDMIEEHAKVVKYATELKKESNGLLNMFKTGSIVNTATHYFWSLNRSYQPAPIYQNETIWLQNVTLGAIIWAKPTGEPVSMYEYDVVSHYPSILKEDGFSIPFGEGKWKKITQEDLDEYLESGKIPYGIFRCNITIPEKTCDDSGEPYFVNGRYSRLFRTNQFGYYTHFDIELAHEFEWKVEINNDVSANAFIYEESVLVEGSKVFGEYVDTLFELKQRNVEYAKPLLNCLWGSLCKGKGTLLIHSHSSNKPTDIYPHKELVYVKPSIYSRDELVIKVRPYDNAFTNNWARLKPFLLSRGRCKIARFAMNCVDYIYRIHTDGFYTTMELDEELCGDKLGDLKFEGCYENCKIINVNNIIKNDIKSK